MMIVPVKDLRTEWGRLKIMVASFPSQPLLQFGITMHGVSKSPPAIEIELLGLEIEI